MRREDGKRTHAGTNEQAEKEGVESKKKANSIFTETQPHRIGVVGPLLPEVTRSPRCWRKLGSPKQHTAFAALFGATQCAFFICHAILIVGQLSSIAGWFERYKTFWCLFSQIISNWITKTSWRCPKLTQETYISLDRQKQHWNRIQKSRIGLSFVKS